MSKLISTFKIGFDDETKAEIASLKAKLDAITGTLGVPSALCGNIKPTGGLLAAMQDTAANDSYSTGLGDCLTIGRELDKKFGNNTTESVLLQLGQWVFEGLPEHIISLGINPNGTLIGSDIPLDEWFGYHETYGHQFTAQDYYEILGEGYDTSDCRNSRIERQPVNDVDYLSESVPEIQGMDAREIIIDELWPDKPVPQITQADMQLIFIKNLSECLIQRMHSMDRFSEDDNAIGGVELMAWDIVANPKGDFGVITGHNQDKRYFGGFYLVPYACGNHAKTVAGERANEYLKTLGFSTITEAELPAFRAALEACYA